MNKNCLVTKLKDSVDNENLQTLGAISVKTKVVASPTYNTQRFMFLTTGPVTLKVIGDECYCNLNYNNLDTDKFTEVTINDASTYKSIFVSPKVMMVEISPKYNIKSISIVECFDKMAGELETFEYCSDIQEISLNSKGIGSNIASLSELTNMVSLRLNNNPIVGDIVSLGKMVSIQTMDVCDRTNVQGNIEDFVHAQYDNGRTSLSIGNAIQSYRLLQTIKFGGKNYNEGYGSIAWDSRTKMCVYAGAKLATNCTKVYCKGYTQEEAETVFSGLTIIRVDA